MKSEGKDVRGLPGRIAGLERELAMIERELASLQGVYEERAGELAEVRLLGRRLASLGLPSASATTWSAVCRALGWPHTPRSAHRTVRSRDRALHALLHRCAFPPYCALDRVTYSR